MCYSAEVEADYKEYVRVWGADISIHEFFRLYWEGGRNSKIKTPKAMDAAFKDPQTDLEREIKPDPGNLAAAYAILDDRWRPYYEYRMAACSEALTSPENSADVVARFRLYAY